MPRESCRLCKRVLKDKESQRRGFGPVCWRKSINTSGVFQEGTNIVLVADDPDHPRDVFFRRLLDGNVETNVAPKSLKHSPTGYNWGYAGSGPADLAFNILLRFTTEENAWMLHQEFKLKFITQAPHNGLTISGEFIKQWIRENTGPKIVK